MDSFAHGAKRQLDNDDSTETLKKPKLAPTDMPYYGRRQYYARRRRSYGRRSYGRRRINYAKLHAAVAAGGPVYYDRVQRAYIPKGTDSTYAMFGYNSNEQQTNNYATEGDTVITDTETTTKVPLEVLFSRFLNEFYHGKD